MRGEWLLILREPLLFCCTVLQMEGEQSRVVEVACVRLVLSYTFTVSVVERS